jgi:hypothetical protein
MRQLKISDEAPKDLASIQMRLDNQSQALAQTQLLVVLNNECGTYPPGGEPLTPELRKRVTELLISIKKTLANLELLAPVTLEPNTTESVDRGRNDIREINKVLGRILFIPQIQLTLDGRSLEPLEEVFVEPDKTLSAAIESQDWTINSLGCSWLESIAIRNIISLLRNNTIDHLRRCDCNEWFMATRSDQRFCSPTCRQKNHAGKPDFNKKRRAYYKLIKKRATRKQEAEANGKER